jgi:hypothetical protein
MAEIRTVTTLRSKRAEIIAAIANYEKRLAQARADLAHITAAITIFEASGDIEEIPPYVDIHRCFKRGEAINLCKEALASGPFNTRQLALKVMAAKGLDTGDTSPDASFMRFASNADAGSLTGRRNILAREFGLCQMRIAPPKKRRGDCRAP